MKSFFITLAFIFLCGTAAYSEGYNVLVIPARYLSAGSGYTGTHENIEEILAQKIIKFLEEKGTACAPDLEVLRLSIKNNPNFTPNTENPVSGAKIISKAYGVSKVLLISSKIAANTASSQKYFWNRLDLPVIIPAEDNIRLVTVVAFVDTQSDDVLWQNIFYKNINDIGNKISSKCTDYLKTDAALLYYDKLTQDIIGNIRESKETYAVRVTDNSSAPEKRLKVERPHLCLLQFKKSPSNISNKDMSKYNFIQKAYFNKIKDILQSKYNDFINDFNLTAVSKAKLVRSKNAGNVKKPVAAHNSNKPKKNYLSSKHTGEEILNMNKNTVYNDYDDIFPSGNYLIKHRNSARNFTLKFDTFVNDM